MPFALSRTLPDRGVTITHARLLTMTLDFRNTPTIQAVVGQWLTEADYLAGASPLYQEMIAITMGDLPPQTIEAVEAVLATRGDWLTGATVLPAAAGSISLAAYMEQCRTQVDALASACRLRFISAGVGQEATYVIKAQEAHAYRLAGYPADTSQYPYVAAEAAATGLSAQAAADALMTTADTWNYILGPRIEGIRRAKKLALESCASSQDMDNVVAAARAAFNGVGS